MTCPLCKNQESTSFIGINDILFWKCPSCYLIYKDQSFHPTPNEEELRYNHHHNNSECEGYVDSLNQALEPSRNYIDKHMVGLDFGCGPEPVLAKMLEETSAECYHYDPIFFPELPDERLDFVISTETFEHFSHPSQELNLITSLLIPSGILTVMTHRWKDDTNLADWWYMRDQTHVCFFHDKTFEYICKKYGFSTEYDDGDKVIILRKIIAWEK
ncbi:class I SAM-dependent methyltransferase [Natronoflexus pectinivorans]|uniref:Methyltransferase family protein n=1 Tax=Natronoflexus pectinivorans TaxID=682526 RepID=A0A4R2GII9_9BACT|nr:class I SAM-dependent methyltransferase [Natronoflexus pectinivorans]TCO08380.1 methyltransferase family protein [Natronoflexus pectinivorans]